MSGFKPSLLSVCVFFSLCFPLFFFWGLIMLLLFFYFSLHIKHTFFWLSKAKRVAYFFFYRFQARKFPEKSGLPPSNLKYVYHTYNI